MGKCLVEGCGGYAISGDICALCAATQPVKKLTKAMSVARAAEPAKPANAKNSPDASVLLMCMGNSTTPNSAFAAACQDYSDRFFAILAKGSPRGGTENVHGCHVFHDTQPSANRTVFFDWQGNNMRVFGVGSHAGGDGTGNDSYTFIWFDGKNKKYTR
ncbi:MAG: hypothetical protein KDB00_12280 [Planctomycetales bacterium]|nr:hypothetical protein [Planctomycetales bacterium]